MKTQKLFEIGKAAYKSCDSLESVLNEYRGLSNNERDEFMSGYRFAHEAERIRLSTPIRKSDIISPILDVNGDSQLHTPIITGPQIFDTGNSPHKHAWMDTTKADNRPQYAKRLSTDDDFIFEHFFTPSEHIRPDYATKAIVFAGLFLTLSVICAAVAIWANQVFGLNLGWI